MIKVTLTKSIIGAKPNQKATAASLGLKKIGDTIVHAEGPVLDGKIKVISHLVTVEQAYTTPKPHLRDAQKSFKYTVRRKNHEAP